MTNSARGKKWLDLLTKGAPKVEGLIDSVKCVKTPEAVYIAVVPDEHNHYPRAVGGGGSWITRGVDFGESAPLNNSRR